MRDIRIVVSFSRTLPFSARSNRTKLPAFGTARSNYEAPLLRKRSLREGDRLTLPAIQRQTTARVTGIDRLEHGRGERHRRRGAVRPARTNARGSGAECGSPR